MATALITRAEARAQGLKRYFSGEPCANGHRSERWVSIGQCIECHAVSRREWRKANGAREQEMARVRNAERRDERHAKYKAWQSTPEGRAVKARLQRERRARLRGITGNHTQADVVEILKAQGHRCAYCRTDVRQGYEVDHIVSLKQGGSNGRRNIQVLCAPCNRRKRTKDPVRFAQEMGLLI